MRNHLLDPVIAAGTTLAVYLKSEITDKRKAGERVADYNEAVNSAPPAIKEALRTLQKAAMGGDEEGATDDDKEAARIAKSLLNTFEKDFRRGRMSDDEREMAEKNDKALARALGHAEAHDFRPRQLGVSFSMPTIAPSPTEAAKLLRARGAK